MISQLNPSDPTGAVDSCKVVVFTIAGHSLALPLVAVQRILATPPLLNLSAEGVNLLHVGTQDIPVVDLYVHLSSVKPAPSPETVPNAGERGQFMIIARSQQRDELGILVDQLPTIVDLPRSIIQPFPPDYRRTTPLGIARYIATLTTETSPQTIFLLDLPKFWVSK